MSARCSQCSTLSDGFQQFPAKVPEALPGLDVGGSGISAKRNIETLRKPSDHTGGILVERTQHYQEELVHAAGIAQRGDSIIVSYHAVLYKRAPNQYFSPNRHSLVLGQVHKKESIASRFAPQTPSLS